MGAGPHMKGDIQGPRITCTEDHRNDRQGTEGKEGRQAWGRLWCHVRIPTPPSEEEPKIRRTGLKLNESALYVFFLLLTGCGVYYLL